MFDYVKRELEAIEQLRTLEEQLVEEDEREEDDERRRRREVCFSGRAGSKWLDCKVA